MLPMLRPLMKYADFRGRASRAEFWGFLLLQNLVFYSISTVIVLAMPSPWNRFHLTRHMLQFHESASLIGAQVIVVLLFLLPGLGVQIRRLHDMGRFGRWVLLPLGILAAGVGIATVFGVLEFTAAIMSNGAADFVDYLSLQPSQPPKFGSVPTMIIVFSFILSIAAQIMLFFFNMLDGDCGTNRYGDDPKGRPDATVRAAMAAATDTYVPLLDFGPGGRTQARDEDGEPAPVMMRHMSQVPRSPDMPVQRRQGFGKR